MQSDRFQLIVVGRFEHSDTDERGNNMDLQSPHKDRQAPYMKVAGFDMGPVELALEEEQVVEVDIEAVVDM